MHFFIHFFSHIILVKKIGQQIYIKYFMLFNQSILEYSYTKGKVNIQPQSSSTY